MRVITGEKFWDNVENHLGEDGYAELYNRAIGVAPFGTLEEAERHWRNETIPAMVEAAKINGCINEDGARKYYEETLMIYMQVVDMHPQLLFDVSDEGAKAQVQIIKEAEVYPLFDEVAEQFHDERVCHGTNSGYVCYCDEKESSAE